jgi:biotin carboxylase
MRMRKILVLGAGVYQIPLIQKAQEAGCCVIAASYLEKDPGLALANESWVVDTTEKEALLARAKEVGVEAVITTGTDVAVPTLGFICDAMNLKGVSYQTALACSDKTLMKEKFKAGGVAMAEGEAFTDADTAQEYAKALSSNYMIKAADSSGSRGVFAMETLDDFYYIFAKAMAVSRSGKVIIEKQLIGEEFGAQLVVQNSQVRRAFFHNDTLTPPPIFVPIGHSCPCRLSDSTLRKAKGVCQQAVTAVGIENAVCNVDLMACDDGVYVFEIGARGGATGLPEVVYDHSGVNLYQVALDLALGNPVACEPQWKKASAMLLLTSQQSGTLQGFDIPKEVKEHPNLTFLRLDKKPGDAIPAFVTGPDRLGDVFVQAPDLLEAKALVEKFVAQVSLRLSKPTS